MKFEEVLPLLKDGCVDCNKTFWMSCKEMYSDKFLDQEIEVEE